MRKYNTRVRLTVIVNGWVYAIEQKEKKSDKTTNGQNFSQFFPAKLSPIGYLKACYGFRVHW